MLDYPVTHETLESPTRPSPVSREDAGEGLAGTEFPSVRGCYESNDPRVDCPSWTQGESLRKGSPKFPTETFSTLEFVILCR